VTCRRKRYDEDAATAKLERLIAYDAAVGLTTEGRAEQCSECGAWHVETKVSRSIFDHDCYPMGKCATCEPEDVS